VHRDVLDELVQLLLINETVNGSEVYTLAHRPEPTGGEGMTVAPDRASSMAGERADNNSGKAVKEAESP
jgi:hypothetical protein